jgi:tetratricopeptide (TPR) repeat protein
MTENGRTESDALIPAAPHGLAVLASVNPLVSRGIDDLSKRDLLQGKLRVAPDRAAAKRYYEKARCSLYNIWGELNLETCLSASFSNINEAIQLDPMFPYAYCLRAEMRMTLRQFDSALEDFGLAIRLEPANPNLFRARGRALLELKDYENAIADYDEFVRGDGSSLAIEERGEACLAAGYFDKAVSDFEKVIAYYGSEDSCWRAIAYCNRAIARFNKGGRGEALEDFKAAAADFEAARLQYNPDDDEAAEAWLLATCPLEEIRNGQRAVDLARAEANGRPSQVIAAAYAESGRFDDAVREMETLGEPRVSLHQRAMRDEVEQYRWRLQLYRRGKPYRENAGPFEVP